MDYYFLLQMVVLFVTVSLFMWMGARDLDRLDEELNDRKEWENELQRR